MLTIITLLFALFLERVQIHSHGLLNLWLLDEVAEVANVLSLPVSQLVDRWLSHQHLGYVPRLLGNLRQLQGLLGGGSQHSSVIVVNLVHQTDGQGLLGGEEGAHHQGELGLPGADGVDHGVLEPVGRHNPQLSLVETNSELGTEHGAVVAGHGKKTTSSRAAKAKPYNF